MSGFSTSPVLIIGMHRSGTSLLTRLLEQQGLYVGWRLAANHEASFFNKRNSWLLASAGGRWDTPSTFDHVLGDQEGLVLAKKYLQEGLGSPAIFEFLGPWRYLRYRSLFAMQEPWGWKDPRTTITLPIWLSLFPNARILHVVRNGIDVAQSLYKRQQVGRSLGRRNMERHSRLMQLVPKKGWFGTSPRAASRQSAFEIWEEYLSYADRFTKDLGEQVLELRFEDLLDAPRTEMERILEFCGLQPATRALDSALQAIRPNRAFSFRHDAELRQLWSRNREAPWMVHHGYDSLELRFE